MTGFKRTIAFVLLAAALASAACTTPSPTNASILSWTYCKSTNKVTLHNSGKQSIFARVEVSTPVQVESNTVELHPGDDVSWAVSGPPYKVRITSYILYNKNT